MAIHETTSILSRRKVTDLSYFKKGTPNVAYLYLCFPYFTIKIIQFGKNKGKKYIDKRFLLKTTVSDNDFIIRNKAFMKL